MNPTEIPLLGSVLRSGARDRVFDAFLLCGPLLVALIAVVGRNPVTTAIAALYVLVFVGYVAYLGLSKTSQRTTTA